MEGEQAWEGFQLEPVSSNASESMNPSVCVDARGQVHMAWEDHRFDHGTEVCYAMRNTTGVLVVEDLPVGRHFYELLEGPVVDYRAYSPNVLIDGDGQACVVFLEEHWRDDSDGTFYEFAIRQIEINPSGSISRTNWVLNWTVATGGFRTSAKIADGMVVEPDDTGGYHLMFIYAPDILVPDRKQVYYIGLDEAFEVSVGPLVLTNYTDSMIWGPDMAVTGGKVHAVLARSPVSTTSSGTSWNTTEYDYMVVDGRDGSVITNVTGFARMESPVGDHGLGALETDADGLVHMVLVGGSDGSLLYARMDASGEVLLGPTSFHEGWNEDVSIDIEGSGVLHAVISSSSDHLGPGSSLWYAEFDLTDDVPLMHHYQARIEGPITPPGQGQAQIAIDTEGHAYIVWDDRVRVDDDLVDIARYTTNAVILPVEEPPEDDDEEDHTVAILGILMLCVVVILLVFWIKR